MAENAGQFKKGHPKMGGRKAGTKMRTQIMTDRILDIVESDLWDEETQSSDFYNDFEQMSPKDRRDVMLKLLKLVMPTIASVSLEDNKTVSSIRQLMENMAAYKKQN